MTDIALIVIDMQEDYVGEKSKHEYNSKELISNINKRILELKQAGAAIIYVKNKRVRKNGNVYICDFVNGLSVVSDYVFEKEKSSIFSNDILIDLLSDNNVRHIEVIGVDGSCCVASSAIDAVKMGFLVNYPLEYIGIKNPQLFLKSKRQKLIKAGVNIIGEVIDHV